MTLPSSGIISLNDINLELGKASGTNTSLNATDVRSLLGKPTPSSTISLSDAWGKGAQGISSISTSTIMAIPSGGQGSTNFGEGNIAIQTANGRKMFICPISNATNAYTSNGWIASKTYASDLGSSSGDTVVTGSAYIRFVTNMDAAAFVSLTSQVAIAWFSYNGTTTSLNMGRINGGLVGSTAFTHVSNNIASFSGMGLPGLSIAINSDDNVLVAYTTRNATSPYPENPSYCIKSSALASVKAVTSLTATIGANCKILGAAAYGTNFYISYYSITNTTFGVLKIDSTGTTVTNYPVTTSATLRPQGSYSVNSSVTSDGVTMLTPIGSTSNFSILKFDMNANTYTVGSNIAASAIASNDGCFSLHRSDKSDIVSIRGNKIFVHSLDGATLEYSSPALTSSYTGDVDIMAARLVYHNNDSLLMCQLSNTDLLMKRIYLN